MIVGIDLKQTVDFVSKYDKGEPKTVWKLGALDYKTFMRISLMSTSENKEAVNDSVRECVRYGLRGVENYNIPFQAVNAAGLVCVDDLFLNSIPTMVMIELSAVIMKNSMLSEEETKN